jgi:hypothetical protein
MFILELLSFVVLRPVKRMSHPNVLSPSYILTHVRHGQNAFTQSEQSEQNSLNFGSSRSRVNNIPILLN